MARVSTEKMSEAAKNRQATGATAQDVAQALKLDIRVIYVLENFTVEQLTELYTQYNKHIETLGKTAETRAKIAELEALAAMAERAGMIEAAADARQRLSELAGGEVELLVNQLGAKRAKRKTQTLEAVAVAV